MVDSEEDPVAGAARGSAAGSVGGSVADSGERSAGEAGESASGSGTDSGAGSAARMADGSGGGTPGDGGRSRAGRGPGARVARFAAGLLLFGLPPVGFGPVGVGPVAMAAPANPPVAPLAQPADPGLTRVPGIEVGSVELEGAPTGCTVVLTGGGAVAGVEVRGSAPGTRETALLDPVHTVGEVHAVVLSGGSAFGLAAADGVMRFLEERGIGYPAGRFRVPIVPAAILFDLGLFDLEVAAAADSGAPGADSGAAGDGAGNAAPRPGPDCGYRAASAAGRGPVARGNAGAGAGASVGKLRGLSRAMKGGQGSASLEFADGLVVAALVAVNAVGDIVDPATGEVVAGVRDEEGGLADARRLLLRPPDSPSDADSDSETRPGRDGSGAAGGNPGSGTTDPGLVGGTAGRPGEPAAPRPDRGGAGIRATTIGVVATNAPLTKAEATKVAQMAQDGLARTIYPAHTPSDGDTLFALSPGGGPPASVGRIGALAAEVVARAVLDAVRSAASIPGLPAARDFPPPRDPPPPRSGGGRSR